MAFSSLVYINGSFFVKLCADEQFALSKIYIESPLRNKLVLVFYLNPFYEIIMNTCDCNFVPQTSSCMKELGHLATTK